MFLKHILIFVGVGFLAACQTTGQSAWEWQPIQRADSRISIVGDDSMVTSREWKRREAGVQERLKFKDGSSLFFEELYGGRYVWEWADIEQSLLNSFKNFNKSGSYTPSKVLQRGFQNSQIFYLTAESPTQKCFFSNAMAPQHQRGASWHFMLSSCRTSRTAASLENDMFALIERLRFDGGELNKQRAAQ